MSTGEDSTERDIHHYVEVILSGQGNGIVTWQSVLHVANTGGKKSFET